VSQPQPEHIAAQRAVIERMFSAIAPRYDVLNRLLSVGRDRVWRREAIRATGLPPMGRLLDVCTGTADMALEAARQFPSAAIAGVDFSGAMIELGTKKAARAAVTDRVRLSVAPAEALPFPDGTFDAVTVAFGLRNVPERLRALSEMHRILKPGGRAVILEFTTPPGRVFRRIYLCYFRRILPVIGGLVSGHRSAYSYLPASVADFPSPPELSAWLEQTGFRDVSYRLLACGISAIHAGVKRSDLPSAVGLPLEERVNRSGPTADR
jgi:demethylmenaquinone methyltransferase/2-methoxy-6-polyprenyl-1,4-benzoquinol methylase